MDASLLRDRESFKKKAIVTPVVEKKRKDTSDKQQSVNKDDANKRKLKTTHGDSPTTSSAASPPSSSSYKTISGTSEYKFVVLAKIVKYMKVRHQDGEDHPLTLEEILDETNQLFVSPKVKQWLETEALINNPKIEVIANNKFLFKAPYKIRDKKSLLRLLKHHDLKGLGGIMLEDVQESLAHCDKVLRQLQSEIIYIQRPADKKKIMFYNDKSIVPEVDEEFKKLWRSINVDNLDDDKIQEYLDKQGIKSFQNYSVRKVAPMPKKKRPTKSRNHGRPRDNEHIADVLETYDDIGNT